MQTIQRMNSRLDDVQAKAPKAVGAWIKLNRAIAGRASTFVGSAFSGLTGSARKVGETAVTSAKTVGKSVETSATKVARTAENEIVDATEDATARIEASTDAASHVRLTQMTKDELYGRAQSLDIEGRSQMTKDALVDAIMAVEGSEQLAR